MKNIFLVTLVFSALACSSVKNNGNSQVNKPSKNKEVIFNKDYMDLSVKPQDDFFLYSNGTWVKNNPVPASESRWGSFNEVGSPGTELEFAL